MNENFYERGAAVFRYITGQPCNEAVRAKAAIDRLERVTGDTELAYVVRKLAVLGVTGIEDARIRGGKMPILGSKILYEAVARLDAWCEKRERASKGEKPQTTREMMLELARNNRCPFCTTPDEPDYGDCTSDHGEMVQFATCHSCKAEWREIYRVDSVVRKEVES